MNARTLRLRRVVPLESQVQNGVLELLRMMPHDVAWCHKQAAGQWVIVRPDGDTSVRRQLEAAANACPACGRPAILKKSQIGWIQGAPEGVLDIALQLVGSGVHCEIEVKQPRKKPTEAQENRIALVRASGGLADVVDDIDKVKPLIESWRKQM